MYSNLIDKFSEYFEIIPAVNSDLKKEVFKLRYQVYCVEMGFEREEDCQIEYDEEGKKIGLEIDEYDNRSAHYLVKHKKSGLYAATVRLVLPSNNHNAVPFPIETNCELDHWVTDPDARKHLAEISRFAVSKEFKRRRGETRTITGVTEQTEVYFEADERRVLPHISVSLISGILRMARQRNITRLYAVMEPALLRLYDRFGIHFFPIGKDIDYHGIRRPCLGNIEELLASIKKTAKPVWELITDKGDLA